MEERLHGYSPHPLTLRTFLSARPDAGLVKRWIPREPESRVWLEGVLAGDGWAGWVGDTPFLVALAGPWQDGKRLGMGVNMPLRLTAHGVPSLSALIELLSEMPAEILGATWAFEPFPFQGAGWGVAPVERLDESGTFFRSPRHEDAATIRDLFNRRCPERPCGLVRVVGSWMWPWIVVGPPAGPFVSWSWALDTLQQAEETAQAYSQRWSTEMRVYGGPVVGEPVAAFRNGARVPSVAALLVLAFCCLTGTAHADVAPRPPDEPCLPEKVCPDGGTDIQVHTTLEELEAEFGDGQIRYSRMCVRSVPSYTSPSGDVMPERRVAVYCRKALRQEGRWGCTAAPSGGGATGYGAILFAALGAFTVRARRGERRARVRPEGKH